MPVFEAHLLRRRPPGRAGIVDEDIDSFEPRDRGIDHVLNAGGIGYVAAHAESADSQRSQLLGSLLAALFLSPAENNVRTHLSETFRHLAAKSHGAARYDRDASSEIEQLLRRWLLIRQRLFSGFLPANFNRVKME